MCLYGLLHEPCSFYVKSNLCAMMNVPLRMINMQISLSRIEELEGNLERIKDVVHDFTPELREIGEWYMGFIQNDVFETEGGVIGESWSNLNPRYAKTKAERYPGRGVLEASGKMRSSWKLYTTTHYALIENFAQGEDGEYYAKHHQEGTGRLPQRMFVKFDEERKNTIVDIFKEGILKRIQRARQ